MTPSFSQMVNPNIPIIELLYDAKSQGYKIVIITARPGINQNINWTKEQLKLYQIPYHYLGFTSAQTKTLMKQHLPYNFILSVGDMPTDLTDSLNNTQHFQFLSQLRQLTNVVIGSSADRVWS